MDGSVDTTKTSARWQQSKHLAFLEFVLIAAIYLADWAHYIFLSAVLYLLPLAWISLRLRGVRWRDIGFRTYRNWSRTVAIGILAGVGIEALELFCTQPLLAALFGEMPKAVWASMSSGGQGDSGSDALSIVSLEFAGGRMAQLVQNRLCKGETHYFEVRADTAEASFIRV